MLNVEFEKSKSLIVGLTIDWASPIKAPEPKSLTSIQESVMSHEMAFASEESRLEDGQVKDINYKL